MQQENSIQVLKSTSLDIKKAHFFSWCSGSVCQDGLVQVFTASKLGSRWFPLPLVKSPGVVAVLCQIQKLACLLCFTPWGEIPFSIATNCPDSGFAYYLFYILVLTLCWGHDILLTFESRCPCWPLQMKQWHSVQWRTQDVWGAGVEKLKRGTSPQKGSLRGTFITYSPLEGHHRGHFIMCYLPKGHSGGHFCDAFRTKFTSECCLVIHLTEFWGRKSWKSPAFLKKTTRERSQKPKTWHNRNVFKNPFSVIRGEYAAATQETD